MEKIRHIMGISGGKDSAALAVFMRDKEPDMEYVFCDTGKELKETYEFIDKLEVYLNKHIIRLPKELPNYSEKYDFDHWVKSIYKGYLPSQSNRWCTAKLKLEPFLIYVGEEPVKNYVGIRADEDRVGLISSKSNIETVFPFRDYNIDKQEVLNILNESGLGLPKYYKWRSRSGCFFCFYQSKKEWVGLLENHPELYEQAMEYETMKKDANQSFTWRQDGSLQDIKDNAEAIKKEYKIRDKNKKSKFKSNAPLSKILDDDYIDDEEEKPCIICHL